MPQGGDSFIYRLVPAVLSCRPDVSLQQREDIDLKDRRSVQIQPTLSLCRIRLDWR